MKALCVAFVCFVAAASHGVDSPQCVRMPDPPAKCSTDSFREFKNLWVVAGSTSTCISSDQGTTWKKVLGTSAPDPQMLPSSLLLGPFNGELFEEFSTSGNQSPFVLHSADGITWKKTPIPVGGDFAVAGNIWAVGGRLGIGMFDLRISKDAGTTWTPTAPLDPIPLQFAFGPRLAGTQGRIVMMDGIDAEIVPHGKQLIHMRLRRLSPNGDRWEDITPADCIDGNFPVESDFEHTLALSCASVDRPAYLAVTNDAGSSWFFREEPFPVIAVQNGGIVASISSINNILVNFRVVYSSNSGGSWRSVGDGLPSSLSTKPIVESASFLGVAGDIMFFKVQSANPGLYECSLK